MGFSKNEVKQMKGFFQLGILVVMFLSSLESFADNGWTSMSVTVCNGDSSPRSFEGSCMSVSTGAGCSNYARTYFSGFVVLNPGQCYTFSAEIYLLYSCSLSAEVCCNGSITRVPGLGTFGGMVTIGNGCSGGLISSYNNLADQPPPGTNQIATVTKHSLILVHVRQKDGSPSKIRLIKVKRK